MSNNTCQAEQLNIELNSALERLERADQYSQEAGAIAYLAYVKLLTATSITIEQLKAELNNALERRKRADRYSHEASATANLAYIHLLEELAGAKRPRNLFEQEVMAAVQGLTEACAENGVEGGVFRSLTPKQQFLKRLQNAGEKFVEQLEMLR